ncbi:MAG: isoprenylcysteine carboxylmethyltransferase family protein [Burkholderiales bacterium]|nr:isoprenylcysteine carboxylmethyltransferase family protein [Burkholderiales bacterium]
MTPISLKLKVPPPVVALVIAALMWIASRAVQPITASTSVRATLALMVAGTGLVLGVAAMRTFSRAGTTVNPMKPQATTVLVTHGVYRFSRNPMYVSLLLYLVGFALFLANWASPVGLALFIIYMNRFQIAPEERVLEERFGEEFDAYRRRVRRWI